jgi:hypothetical protein
MSETRIPVGFDSRVIAGLLIDLRDELRQLNSKHPSVFKHLFWRFYWLTPPPKDRNGN